MTTMLIVFAILLSVLSWVCGFYLGKSCGMRETHHFLDEQWRDYKALLDLIFKELGIEVEHDGRMSKEHAYAYESGYQDGLRCAKAENDKLRELAQMLINCAESISAEDVYYERDVDGCRFDCMMNGENCSFAKMCDRARELGIEVE